MTWHPTTNRIQTVHLTPEERAAIDDAKEAEAFSEQLEDMLTIAIDALKKIAACDDDNVAKYIQTVDTLALDALAALKEKLK